MLVGCNKVDSNKVIDKFEKILNNNSMYTLTAEMDIVSNEELYHYDVKVDYMEKDYYKATLTNKDNNHEQIILKNDKGVFVKTQESTKQKLNVI